MSSFTLSHITDLVALRRGEFPDCRTAVIETTYETSLSAMIETMLEERARQLTRAAPPAVFTEYSDFSNLFATPAYSSTSAYGEVLLPADFCRLGSLRLKEWSRSLSDEFHGDSLRVELCENAPLWLMSRPGRPWLRIFDSCAGRRLRFGPTSTHIPEEATYIPLPAYQSSGALLTSFDPTLLTPLIDELLANLPAIT